MRIYVPSAHRAGDIGWGVLRFASPAMRDRTTVVVPVGQGDEYKNAIWPSSVAEIVECPEQGIARTRHWIGRHAAQARHEKFLMLDDDVWFYTRVTPDHTQLAYSSPDQVDDMLGAVELWLDTNAHVGISPREGNNRSGPGGEDHAAHNTRTLRALAYRTEEFLSVEHGRVEVMEDFDVNLQLLRRGHPNANLMYWSQGQRMTNAPGGCSTYRSHEVHERSARRLAELHPGLVRLVQKQNKTDREGFGTRTEVVISWKKAYEQGAGA